MDHILVYFPTWNRASLSFVQKGEGMCSCMVTPIGSRQCLPNLKQFSSSLFLSLLYLPGFQAVVILVMQSTCIYAVSALIPVNRIELNVKFFSYLLISIAQFSLIHNYYSWLFLVKIYISKVGNVFWQDCRGQWM